MRPLERPARSSWKSSRRPSSSIRLLATPGTARELIQRLSQRLREADDRIVSDEKRSSRANRNCKDADNETLGESVNNAYLAAKNPWLQRQFRTPLGLGDRPFIVGRRPIAGEALPQWPTDLMLDDTAPFRLSRNHFIIERRDGGYHVRDLRSTLGTIVNGEPIGDHCRTDDALLQDGENEMIAGGVDSPFVFSVFTLRQAAALLLVGRRARHIAGRNLIASVPLPHLSKALESSRRGKTSSTRTAPV
jgi:FHA domain